MTDEQNTTPLQVNSISESEWAQHGEITYSNVVFSSDFLIPTHYSGLKEYEQKLSQLSEDVAKIAERVETGSAIDPSTIKELADRLDQVADAGGKLSAPVMIPAPEDMAVRLVSAGALDRLEEYHSDDTLYLTLFGLFAGGGFGIVVNTITQPREPILPSVGPLYWVTLGLLAVVSVVFLAQSLKVRKRVAALKRTTLSASIRGNPSDARARSKEDRDMRSRQL